MSAVAGSTSPQASSPTAAELTDEIGRLDQDLRALGSQIDRYINLVGVIVAAVVALGLVSTKKDSYTPLLAPYGLMFLMTYLAQLYTDAEMRISTREFLENKVNEIHGVELMLQPRVIDAKYRNRTSVRLSILYFIVGLGGAIIVSLVQAQRLPMPSYLREVHYAALFLSLLIPLQAARELLGAAARTSAILSPGSLATNSRNGNVRTLVRRFRKLVRTIQSKISR